MSKYSLYKTGSDFFIGLSLFLIGCATPASDQKGECERVLSVDIAQVAPFDITRVADLEGLVALESHPDGLLYGVEHVFDADSLLVIWDRPQGGRLLVFDKTGAFLHLIGRKGAAPEEYSEITFMWLDPATAEVVVLDRMKFSLIYYDLKGSFLRREKIDWEASSFSPDSSGCWFVIDGNNPDPSQLLVWQGAGEKEEVQAYIPFPNFTKRLFPLKYEAGGFFRDDKNRLYYYSPYQALLYKAAAPRLIPFIRFDFGARSRADADLTFNGRTLLKRIAAGGLYRRSPRLPPLWRPSLRLFLREITRERAQRV